MASRKSGSIENTLSAFVKLENELVLMKSQLEELRNKLLETAEREAVRAKADCLTNAKHQAAQMVESARRDAEAEAREIEKKGETKTLETTITRKFEDAASTIVSSVTTA